MDLGAYMQIPDLEQVMKDNNISVPRLRGLRLMSEEGDDEFYLPTNEEDAVELCEDLLTARPFASLNPVCYSFGPSTDKLKKRYMVGDRFSPEGKAHVIWSKIHGKLRRNLKFALKQRKKLQMKQKKAWEKYKGRDDVLYIHARIGGDNWVYYEGYKLEKEPWFLEKVDDWWDRTYCDIYAKIKPLTKAST